MDLFENLNAEEQEARSAIRVAVILAKTRYNEQVAPFATSPSRKAYASKEVERIITECANECYADRDAVAERFFRLIADVDVPESTPDRVKVQDGPDALPVEGESKDTEDSWLEGGATTDVRDHDAVLEDEIVNPGKEISVEISGDGVTKYVKNDGKHKTTAFDGNFQPGEQVNVYGQKPYAPVKGTVVKQVNPNDPEYDWASPAVKQSGEPGWLVKLDDGSSVVTHQIGKINQATQAAYAPKEAGNLLDETTWQPCFRCASRLHPMEAITSPVCSACTSDLLKMADGSFAQGDDPLPIGWTPEDKEEVFQYLDDLRESGQINMFGAAPYVAQEFGIDVKDARKLFQEWAETFEQRHHESKKKKHEESSSSCNCSCGTCSSGEGHCGGDSCGVSATAKTALVPPSQTNPQTVQQPEPLNDGSGNFRCPKCGCIGTQAELQGHVATCPGPAATNPSAPQQPYQASVDPDTVIVKLADPPEDPQATPAGPGAEQPVDADEGLSDSANPAEHFDNVIANLANEAAARQFSQPDDDEVKQIADRYGLDPEEVRKSLHMTAQFGDFSGVNGKVANGNEAEETPDGYTELDVQGLGGRVDTHEAIVPVQMAVKRVADDLHMSPEDVYATVTDAYGADLTDHYHTSVSGEHHFFLPEKLVGGAEPADEQQAQPQQQPQQQPQIPQQQSQQQLSSLARRLTGRDLAEAVRRHNLVTV